MQAAWKIHAPRKIMKGRAPVTPVPRPRTGLQSLLSRLFCCRAPAKYMDSRRGNGEMRVLYRVSKENRRRCNDAAVVAVCAISFFFFFFVRFEKSIERAVLCRLWNSALAAFACLRVLPPPVSRKNVHWWSTSPRGTVSHKALLHGRIKVRWNTMYKRSLAMRDARFVNFFRKEKKWGNFLLRDMLSACYFACGTNEMCFKRTYK